MFFYHLIMRQTKNHYLRVVIFCRTSAKANRGPTPVFPILMTEVFFKWRAMRIRPLVFLVSVLMLIIGPRISLIYRLLLRRGSRKFIMGQFRQLRNGNSGTDKPFNFPYFAFLFRGYQRNGFAGHASPARSADS